MRTVIEIIKRIDKMYHVYKKNEFSNIKYFYYFFSFWRFFPIQFIYFGNGFGIV